MAWVHSVFRSKGIDEWTPGGAAGSLDECKRSATTAASNTAREVRAQNDRGTVITQAGPVVEFTYASGRASLVFVCLPDTVDPSRPPLYLLRRFHLALVDSDGSIPRC